MNTQELLGKYEHAIAVVNKWYHGAIRPSSTINYISDLVREYAK